ncbi:MAG: type I secretion system permease/ATPase, partial [Deltaproteobacteria bacterium]|nr:type I secretion system permease/ATPase [Deltaproteobacteria bacterium]
MNTNPVAASAAAPDQAPAAQPASPAAPAGGGSVAGVLRDSAPPVRPTTSYGTLTDSAIPLRPPPPRPQTPQPQTPQPGSPLPVMAGAPLGTPAPQMDDLDALTAQLAELPEPADVVMAPPLILAIVHLFKLQGRSVAADKLTATLPQAEPGKSLHPSACLRAARAFGLHCKTLYRPTVDDISRLNLPCILLLRKDKACLLVGMDATHVELVFPENETETRRVSKEDLTTEYVGYAIYARLEAKLDKRASEIRLLKGKRWFWDTLFHFMPIYRHVLLGSFVVNMLALAGPLFSMNVFDRVVPNNATDTLWVLAIGIFLTYVFDFLLRNLRSHFVDVAGQNADVVLASKLMQQLLHMRLDSRPDSTGAMANNLREFESLREFFGSSTLLALVDLPFLVVFLFIVAFIGGPLVVIPMAAVPIVILVGIYMQFPLQRLTEQGFKENMQKNALLVEIINGLETVKTCMAEGQMQHTWEKVVAMNSVSNRHTKFMASMSMTVSLLATQIVSVGVVIWGVYLINDGSLTMGGLIGCNMLASRAMAPLSQIATMLNRLQHSRMSLKSLDMLMAMPTERADSDSYVEFGHLDHSLTLEDLSFKYPNSERFAMQNVNMHIAPGEKVGIIGRMGSGKTTLGRLSLGLYQPTEGAVKLGGVDIRQLDPATLRSRIGYVSQDNYLFYGTVRENIAFGRTNVDDRMILRAATIAGVTDFIRAHPAGFGMMVGERGMSLSGGQRQAVAIARA